MANDNIIDRYELHVVFEEGENSSISWHIRNDDRIESTMNRSYEDLTEAGAPLSAVGIRVLQDLLTGSVIELALNKADNYRWRRLFRRVMQSGATTEDGIDAPLTLQ